MQEKSLDPEDWPEFRVLAHKMLDAALDKMQTAEQGRVWTPLPDTIKRELQSCLPETGRGSAAVQSAIEDILPYGVGNTHPRFFGWVHGSGSTSGLIADMAAAAINANLGGRDHGAIYVEKQVIEWCRQIFEFPTTASGLLVSGTSMATVIALKTARDLRLNFTSRRSGLAGRRLVGYTSSQTHSCVARAFDILGMGSDALRLIPVDDNFEMNIGALKEAILRDKAAGHEAFCVIGTAGSVNVGSIDDLAAIAEVAVEHGLWFHIDGAFGASGVLSDELRPRLIGLQQADSLAMDFHKWLHVNYDAGLVMIRDGKAHLRAFTERPEYLKASKTGLAAGNHWPVEYGPELSRGFRALKVWAQIAEHGTDKLGRLISQNCKQARYLAGLVEADSRFELLAPVAMNICCFRFLASGYDAAELDQLNEDIVIALQTGGVAAPSTTRLDGKLAIRVNITNHRTRFEDMDLLLLETAKIGALIQAG